MLSYIFVFFVIIILIQIFYYAYLFGHFSFVTKTEIRKRDFPKVSVLVSCRNEENNLEKTIEALLNQDYPFFELILIDDASTDSTLDVISDFAKKNDIIKIVKIPISKTYSGNKKNALTKGIAVASHEYLLFTDADCIPKSSEWLSHMVHQLFNDKEIVLGYGAYKKEEGLLNSIIRYETVLTAWQYFSYALIGIPYMGVGRNLAYKKSLFNIANGFASHRTIKSGDDDLFISQVATSKNTAICWDKKSHTCSEPKKTFKEWLQQKRRHITTATHYDFVHQLLLGTFFVSQLLFFLFAFVLLMNNFMWYAVLFLILIRYLFYYYNLRRALKKLQETDLIFKAPFLELLLIIFQIRIFMGNLWQKPKDW